MGFNAITRQGYLPAEANAAPTQTRYLTEMVLGEACRRRWPPRAQNSLGAVAGDALADALPDTAGPVARVFAA